MRFKEEIENPMVLPFEEEPTSRVSFCIECGEPLFDDEQFLEWEGVHFCEEYCLLEHLNVKKVEGWEIE